MIEQIGPYLVTKEIGRGGMGVVFLARDTRLDRDVAIKALPDDFAADPVRLDRFEREAKTLAQLNHPNIAQIYGVEEREGQRYLVLEYVEGETLGDRLDRGALPMDEAIEIAAGIACGVEAAHDAGVIHRDLKPDNIKITPKGSVKVLDFGLARSTELMSSASGMNDSPTLTSPVHSPTIPGAIFGTAAYMSPEQARGRAIDKRTDVWSFGVILYEMLSGMGPFHGETATDSIGAVLHKDIDLHALPLTTPANVKRVLRRCLERDKSKRYRDIGDARIDLTDPAPAQFDTASPVAAAGWRPAALIGLVCIVLGSVLGFVLNSSLTGTRDVPGAPRHVELMPPPATTILATGDIAGPAVISPDGTQIAYTGRDADHNQFIWVRRLDETDARLLPGTERGVFPFWSPDSKSLGFFDRSRLKRIDIATGFVTDLAPARSGRGGAWTHDGYILFSPDFQHPIYRVPAAGGEVTAVTTVDPQRHTSHRWPFVLGESRKFLFIAVHHDPGRAADNMVYLATYDGDAEPVEILHCDYAVEVVDDHLLFVRDGTLYAVEFDMNRGRMIGDPVGLVASVAADLSTWRATFSASPAGVLTYHRAINSDGANQNVNAPLAASEANGCTIVLRDGRPFRTIAQGIPQNSCAVSRDGTQLAIAAVNRGLTDYDVWVHGTSYSAESMRDALEEDRLDAWESAQRVTSTEGMEVSPIFSPDGTELVYGRVFGTTQQGMFRKRIGGGREELLIPSEPTDTSLDNVFPTDWSLDGRFILVHRGSWIDRGSGGTDSIWVYSTADGEIFRAIDRPGTVYGAKLSPNSRWIAYAYIGVDDTDAEIYVEPFAPGWENSEHPPPPAGSRWSVSIAGGVEPRWSDTGDELFYLGLSGSLIGVNVDTEGPVFSHDTGEVLFQLHTEPGTYYDVFPGAEAFVVNTWLRSDRTPVSVVLNWKSLLENESR